MKVLGVISILGLVGAFSIPFITQRDGVITDTPYIREYHIPKEDKRVRVIEYKGVKYYFLNHGKGVTLINKDSI